MKPFVLRMGGEAGYGIASSGLTFSKFAARSGFYIFNYLEYPSLIRGGHNVFTTAVSKDRVHAPYKKIDFLIALNQETVDKHFSDLNFDGGVLYDSQVQVAVPEKKGIHHFDVPINSIAKDVGGALLMRDIAALGATLGLFGGELKILKELIDEEFKAKEPEVRENNYKVALAGYNFVKDKYSKYITSVLNPVLSGNKTAVMTGNEAAALASVAAGMQFAAIYPMTPTSNILHILAPLQEKYNFIYKQPEDEVSAINMAIGASFAGVRSMVATSGGGFCLMTEGLGLAGIAETPVVIIEGMRGGPATGLPTWTEQGDLRFVLHSHQSDFPRIVLAPGDAKETFECVMEAFNIAEKYQTPVIVLVDKLICESHQNFAPFDYSKYKVERGKLVDKKVADYGRYKLSPDGISPRSILGVGNFVMGNSDEHTEAGFSTEEIEVRNQQMRKRMKKLVTCSEKEKIDPEFYGPEKADLTIVSWGSTKGVILEALKSFKNVNFIHLKWLSPFPTQKLSERLLKAKKILNIEGNYTAQLAGLITEKTSVTIHDSLLKYDGRPFFVEEIISEIRFRL